MEYSRMGIRLKLKTQIFGEYNLRRVLLILLGFKIVNNHHLFSWRLLPSGTLPSLSTSHILLFIFWI